jgi:hypothetical protein
MVTDAILGVLTNVITWFLEHLPTLTLPTYLTDTGAGTLNGTVGSLASSLWSLDAFLPVTQLVLAGALVLASMLLAVAVRVVRIVASFLLAGGGSAA